MNLKLLQPPEHLRPFIKECWSLEHIEHDNPQVFAPIADGCPGLIFSQSDSDFVFTQNDHPLPPAYIYGQTTAPANIRTGGKFTSVGIYFQPHALKTIFGLEAAEFTDGCLVPDLLPRPKGSALTEQLLNSLSMEEQFERLYAWLFYQLQHNRSKPLGSGLLYAIGRIIETNGSIPLAALQQYLQVSERSFERGFKNLVGIGPKLFARICRFQASMGQLRNNKYEKLSDIAYDNDYSDQSHFIRVFKEFTGCSPFEYRQKAVELVRNFPILRM